VPECFRLWLVRLKVITFQFLDWPLQSHLEVEMRTDHGVSTMKKPSSLILDPLLRPSIEFTMMKECLWTGLCEVHPT